MTMQHGESEFNVLGKIGGDAGLSARGERYAQALATKINSMHIPELRVLTSRLRRTIATARGIEAPQEHVAALNELHAGVCEGLSYEEMQEQYPQVGVLECQNSSLFSREEKNDDSSQNSFSSHLVYAYTILCSIPAACFQALVCIIWLHLRFRALNSLANIWMAFDILYCRIFIGLFRVRL